MLNCTACGRGFSSASNLKRHQKSAHQDTDVFSFSCEICNQSFRRRDNLKRHRIIKHDIGDTNEAYECTDCRKSFNRSDVMKRHQKVCKARGEPPAKIPRVSPSPLEPKAATKTTTGASVPSTAHVTARSTPSPETAATATEPSKQGPKTTFKELSRAMRGNLKSLRLVFPEEQQDDISLSLTWSRKHLKRRLRKELQELGAIKWSISIQVRLVKYTSEGEVSTIEPHFRSKNKILLRKGEIKEQLKIAMEKIPSSFSDFQSKGSGWVLDKVLHIDLHIAKYKPLKGSSYLPLPSFLARSKSIINIKNKDQKCFMWCVLAKLYPQQQNAQRVGKYTRYQSQLNFTDISFPVTLDKLAKFEKQNEGVSVNVYGLEQREIFPLYLSPHRARTYHVNLLLISDGSNSHYCLIKNLHRFLSHQSQHKSRMYYCPFCLHGFVRQDLLDDHIELCSEHAPQRVELPSEGNNSLKFENFSKQLKVPFVIYADFECLLQPIEDSQSPKSENTSYTTAYQEHIPTGFAYYVVSVDENLSSKEPVLYRGPNAAEVFLQYLQEEETNIFEILEEVIPLHMTDEDKRNFNSATVCHICEQEFDPGDEPVRDHCHLTGNYRGAAHSDCNLNFQFRKRIPVIFHNLKNYDGHLIAQALGKFKDEELRCIPNNMEKYISFSMGKLDFIDSFQFMSSSLAKLVDNLAKEGPSKFPHVSNVFSDQEKIDLLLRKGVYPYEYIDSFDRFEETSLPSKSAFYSSLTDESISSEDYQHAQNVWDIFDIKNLGEYHDLYLQSDVLLLADVFENFREVCQRDYKLDPAHYFTVPGLAWDAMLKLTTIELELLTDPTMYLFVENAIRGGISTVTNRYSQANNPYLENYDVDKPTTYVTYLDCNNLYGTSMSESLPTGNFHWLTQSEIDHLRVEDIADDSSEGYILECDLGYPGYLHDAHSDYPLAAEKMKITEDMLSPYCKELLEHLGLPFTSTINKLVPNLYDKNKYILHYRNLKLYLELGMTIKKVYRVLAFNQSPWLKSYIDFNTNKRKAAANAFEKDFFKLMNNSVFGKSFESIRRRILVELLTAEEKVRKRIASPTFESFRLFPNDLVAVHRRKTKLLLNKPIYVGFCVLELSKVIMYDFHYNFIKDFYGQRAKLLFTDTDSLTYEIQTDDLYDDMLQSLDFFDTSDYPSDHFLHSVKNKKVLGKFKDECNGNPVQEFVGLRSKMYSMWYEENGLIKEKKTAKGVTKSVTKKKLKHHRYKECLLRRKILMSQMNQIRSKDHQLRTIYMNKIGLSPFDDKRYILANGCDTLAHGHYRISELHS